MAIVHRDTDYAVRALARLAVSGELTPVSALAEAEDVPVSFLRKIMQKLNRADLVRSEQGPFGGYALSRAPEGVTLLDVLEAVQGPLAMSDCIGSPDFCPSSGTCPLRNALGRIQKVVNREMGALTLADIAAASAPQQPEEAV